MKRLALVLALGGCDAVFGLDTPKLHDGGGSADAGIECPGAEGWQVRQATERRMVGVLRDALAPSRCPASSIPTPIRGARAMRAAVCLIEGDTIGVTATVTAGGSKPLVLAAATAIDVGAILDVSSTQAATGPAANFANCQVSTAGGASSTGGGGGGGGSWSTQGGGGGVGGGLAGNNGAGGEAGKTFDAPIALRGGCSGADGGAATGGGGGGTKGNSGGAVYLTSPLITLESNAAIISGGLGGRGGVTGGASNGGGGGGGGGTGGLIVLDTGSLVVSLDGNDLREWRWRRRRRRSWRLGISGSISDAPGDAAGPGSGTMPGGGTGGTGAIHADDATYGSKATPASSAGAGGGGGGQGFILLFSMNRGPASDDARVSPPVIIE